METRNGKQHCHVRFSKHIPTPFFFIFLGHLPGTVYRFTVGLWHRTVTEMLFDDWLCTALRDYRSTAAWKLMVLTTMFYGIRNQNPTV